MVGTDYLHSSQHGWSCGETGDLQYRHSLIVQAIVDAYNKDVYRPLLRRVSGIVFMGTPHRGADLANLLSHILKGLFSKKKFVEQLRPDCDMIIKMSDLFKDRAEKLNLVSFWEQAGIGVSATIFRFMFC